MRIILKLKEKEEIKVGDKVSVEFPHDNYPLQLTVRHIVKNTPDLLPDLDVIYFTENHIATWAWRKECKKVN
jgi:hypothetical protein